MKTGSTANRQEVTIREIGWQAPHVLFQRFAHEPFALLLDTATPQPGAEESWSYIALDPVDTVVGHVETHGNLFDVLKEKLGRWPAPLPKTERPPFSAGAAGFFGYGLGRALEVLPPQAAPFAIDDQNLPDMALGFYDLVIAFNMTTQRAYISAYGEAAGPRLSALEARLHEPVLFQAPYMPHHGGDVAANFTRMAYEKTVARVIAYIEAGDIFQANLSQRFEGLLATGDDPYSLYLRLRDISPAPFASYFNFGGGVIVSSSPERFLACRDHRVETRPIKGTRPRGATIAEDQRLAAELRASEKDRAENIMIVDLLRNDLSRVCADHTVHASRLCDLESYASVHHLVSVVHGTLRDDKTTVDLLAACFPGGSITGAPKLRAMEIIAELEPTTRGPYCGAMGYIGFDGSMDTAIAIRTMVVKQGRVTFQAGGGIVADSDPASEYLETLDKARAMRKALTGESVESLPELGATGT